MFEVTFWGVRGTNPVSGQAYEKTGGNTSCVSALINQEHLIVFDGGTGLYDLGRWLNTTQLRTIHLYISHLHLDHVIGLPFFAPLWDKQYTIKLYSTYPDLKGFLNNHIFQHPMFPVALDIAAANLTFEPVVAHTSTVLAQGIRIKSCPLNHPGGSTGYRLEAGQKSMCYITDVEHEGAELDQTILNFIAGCNLFIYDSAYTREEYMQKRGWGHSTHIRGAELAKSAGVGQLALFHHDPSHDDDLVARIEAEAQTIFKNAFAARQGLVVKI